MRKKRRKTSGPSIPAATCDGAVICEDPETGKIVLRFDGKCNKGERARLIAKIATDGINIPREDANEAAK